METAMTEPTIIHDTFVLERRYVKAPDRVFAMLGDPALKRRWYAENADTFDMDFREGGREYTLSHLGPETPFPDAPLVSDCIYQHIVPDQRVVLVQTMSLGGRAITSALITFELLANEEGTTLLCTHQGAFYEGSGGTKMRKEGWEVLLGRLDRELAR
jgi:uncharacterized protein YndB with AHSA1/START domain